MAIAQYSEIRKLIRMLLAFHKYTQYKGYIEFSPSRNKISLYVLGAYSNESIEGCDFEFVIGELSSEELTNVYTWYFEKFIEFVKSQRENMEWWVENLQNDIRKQIDLGVPVDRIRKNMDLRVNSLYANEYCVWCVTKRLKYD